MVEKKVNKVRRETGIYSDYFINDFVTTPIEFVSPSDIDTVHSIEKPAETFEELYFLATRNRIEFPDYEISHGIVTCGKIATSISPNAFNMLSEEEKRLVVKFPNSDMALALLQRNKR